MRSATKAFTLGLAGLALALPGIAEAAGPCPVVRAMLAEHPRRLKGIGVTINSAGSMDVAISLVRNRKTGSLRVDVSLVHD